MLVLTRKVEESIMIGDNIEIKIVSTEDGKVRIGIEAPKNIEVYRKEVYLNIQEENKSAAEHIININDLHELMKKALKNK